MFIHECLIFRRVHHQSSLFLHPPWAHESKLLKKNYRCYEWMNNLLQPRVGFEFELTNCGRNDKRLTVPLFFVLHTTHTIYVLGLKRKKFYTADFTSFFTERQHKLCCATIVINTIAEPFCWKRYKMALKNTHWVVLNARSIECTLW